MNEKYLNELNEKVFTLEEQGQLDEAVILAEKVLKLAQSLYKKHDPHIATSLNNLAFLYKCKGNLSQAEPLYQQALEMRKRLNDPNVAESLNNLGELYQSQGKLSQAEQLYAEALSMNNHPYAVQSLSNLAALYQYQGKLSEAKDLYIQALEIENHPHILNNLGLLCKSQGRLGEAEKFYMQALTMWKLKFPGNHPNIATALNNLAELYRLQENLTQAAFFLDQALTMWKLLFKEDHPDVVKGLNNLASLYYCQGKFNQAESLFKQALAIKKRLFLEDHPDVIKSLNNLAIFYITTDNPTKAVELMQESITMDDRLLRANFTYSSERDRLTYIDNIRHHYDGFLSVISTYFSNNHDVVKIALDVVLKRKCITATALAAFNFAIYSERYSHLQPEFQRLRSLREQLTHLMFDPPFIQPQEPLEQYRQRRRKHQQLVAELQQESEQLEKQLASQVPEIQLQDQETDRRAVALALPKGSALVEFVRFRVCDFKAEQWQPAQYLAFILPAQQPDAVQMILLGDAEPIDRLIKVFRETISELRLKDLRPRPKTEPPQQKSYLEAEVKLQEAILEAGIKLQEAIYKPILKQVYLAKYSHLMIAPDAELSLVPFGILPLDDSGKQLLMDQYQISYLSSGRDILRGIFQTERQASPPLIVADPDFDLTQKVCSEGFSPCESPEGLTTNDVIKRLGGEDFDPVPETGILAKKLAEKLGVKPYLQQEALESLFSRLNCPSILLIATHGYFQSGDNDNSETKNSSIPRLSGVRGNQIQGFRNSDRFSSTSIDNALMRSGLALAGANTWKQGGNLPPEAGKGFLFAQDVAVLDLWQNELTILTACESGLGDVKIGEGVFGLRRAFAVAGCKTLVMSLWSVPTKASILLMDKFLDLLQSGYGRYEALVTAQNYIRSITIEELQQFPLGQEILAELETKLILPSDSIKNNPNTQVLNHPYFWAAWVCQGDTSPFPQGKL